MPIPLFDAHCDTAFEMFFKNQSLNKNSCHIDLEKASAFSPYAQFFAIWGVPEHANGMGYRSIFDNLLSNLETELLRNSERISLCRSAGDAQKAAAEHKAAAFICVEGAELLNCDPDLLEPAYSRGVRMVTLTWNTDNPLCGCNGKDRGKPLTDLGRAFVRRCNELRIIVDLSHCSEAAFWDVIEYSSAPVIASHSDSAAMHPHPRNLSDDQFRAIVQKGGVAGINLYSELLSGGEATLDTVIRHIDHYLSLGGWHCVAIGSDFDGCDSLPAGIETIADLVKLHDVLVSRGYGPNDIFYNNLMEVVNRVCGI